MAPVKRPNIHVAKRYVRSVELNRDLEDDAALNGYVVTPSVRDATLRILNGLARSSTQRAFRVTGPYGAGKSAFALFLARLTGQDKHHAKLARALLGRLPSDLPEIGVYSPVTLVGRRKNLADALAEGVHRAASGRHGARRATGALKRAAEILRDRSKGRRDDAKLLELLGDYAKEAKTGVLLLIDEFGRFLEYAALNRREIDPAFFQQLAELAGGRQANPIAVVAFLHHRFSDYAAGLGEWVEAEWVRSAEGYEDILFHDSTEQIAFLLAQAIVHEPRLSGAAASEPRQLYREAVKRTVFLTDESEIQKVATSLAPLHPAAVAALAHVATRFGQNERSVFSFLQSLEPYGFQRFIMRNEGRAWYRLSDLYDYVSAQGSARFRSADRERRWELSKHAIVQNAEADVTEIEVLKTIGLISVLEPIAGLRADAQTVAWCIGRDRKAVEAAIQKLIAKNLLYRRPHRGDLCLWASSSVDLEQWLEQAQVKVQPAKRLDAALARLSSANPLVAHKHYHRTGTLRSFSVVGWDGIGEPAATLQVECDGAVVVVPQYPDETDQLVQKRITGVAAATDPLRLFCVRRIAPADLAAARDLEIWQWIEGNCKELRVDDLARREVRSRIASAEERLRLLLRPLMNPNGSSDETWIYLGKPINIHNRRGLNRKLSDICDSVFNSTPILRNELINRSALSSAAATARMRLLEAMVQFESTHLLGMTGAPPERSIFLSVFEATGMHRKSDETYRFLPPRQNDTHNWLPAWNCIQNLLKAKGASTFEELTNELSKPPIGLRRGPALILIAAFMLNHRSDVALMERNSFQPEITPAHFMRLAKTPANFSLRYLGHSRAALDLLERLAADLEIWSGGVRPQPVLKEVVEAIYRWWGPLPAYAKETVTVSKAAKEVRQVLRKALEPIDFVFKQLPAACGLDEFDIKRKQPGALTSFIETLNDALSDIAEAPRRLRAKTERALLEAFDAPTIAALRSTIRNEYARHRLQLAEYRLRAFIDRAAETELSDDAWLDSIASILTGKRLDVWQDETADTFGFEARAIAARLIRWLAHMREQGATKTKLVTVHVVDTSGEERMVVVRPGSLAKEAAAKVAEIRKILASHRDPTTILAHVIAAGTPVASVKEDADG